MTGGRERLRQEDDLVEQVCWMVKTFNWRFRSLEHGECYENINNNIERNNCSMQ